MRDPFDSASVIGARTLAPMIIDGSTETIAHIGYPTHTFRAPLIYNPYFASIGQKTLVVPMACNPKTSSFSDLLRVLFSLDNTRAALITMPYKMRTVDLVDQVGKRAQVAGSCNVVRRTHDGKLIGDMYDGEGFVRALHAQGRDLGGKTALLIGCGGVGSAIAASLADAGIAQIRLFDMHAGLAASLAQRLNSHYPRVKVSVMSGAPDPKQCDMVINATPLGMNDGDAMPLDVNLLNETMQVGEVVLSSESTPFLLAAKARGCEAVTGFDMLFEQIPPILEFFELPSTTADVLRAVAQINPPIGLAKELVS